MKIKHLMHNAQITGEKVFIPFIPAGYPDLNTTEKIILDLEKLNIQAIELGIPYSDPGADGPTIVSAYDHAIKNNITLLDCLNLVRRLRNQGSKIGIILFSYYNPIFVFGEEKFAKLAKESGIDSVLIVDLPIEESLNLKKFLNTQSIGLVHLATPTTPPDRLKLINQTNADFIYYVSRTGVTGPQSSISKTLQKEIIQLKNIITIPVAIGFGISTPKQAKAILQFSDGFIVGSALVALMKNYPIYIKTAKSFQSVQQHSF